MRVYFMSTVDASEGLVAVDPGVYAFLRTLSPARSEAATWAPVAVERTSKAGKRRPRKLLDIARFQGWYAFSARARDALSPALADRMEWLSLEFAEAPYALMNVLRCIPAIAHDPASIAPEATRPIDVYAFDESAVAQELVFKVPEWSAHLLVTDRFVDLVREHGLKGFHFWPVWDSQLPPFKYWPNRQEIPLNKAVYGPGGILGSLFKEYWPAEWKQEAAARS